MAKKKTTKKKAPAKKAVTPAKKKQAALKAKLAAQVDEGKTGAEPARRSIAMAKPKEPSLFPDLGESAKPKPDTGGGAKGGAKGSNISVYLTDGDQLLSRQIRARLSLERDCGLSQSQLLRVGLLIMDKMKGEALAAVADQVKALDGRRRS